LLEQPSTTILITSNLHCPQEEIRCTCVICSLLKQWCCCCWRKQTTK